MVKNLAIAVLAILLLVSLLSQTALAREAVGLYPPKAYSMGNGVTCYVVWFWGVSVSMSCLNDRVGYPAPQPPPAPQPAIPSR